MPSNFYCVFYGFTFDLKETKKIELLYFLFLFSVHSMSSSTSNAINDDVVLPFQCLLSFFGQPSCSFSGLSYATEINLYVL